MKFYKDANFYFLFCQTMVLNPNQKPQSFLFFFFFWPKKKLGFLIWVFHKKVHITQGDLEGKAVIVSWVTQKARGSNTVLYWKEHSCKMLKARGKSKTYKFYNYTSGHIHHCPISNLEVHHHHFIIFYIVVYLILCFSSCSMTPSTTIW